MINYWISKKHVTTFASNLPSLYKKNAFGIVKEELTLKQRTQGLKPNVRCKGKRFNIDSNLNGDLVAVWIPGDNRHFTRKERSQPVTRKCWLPHYEKILKRRRTQSKIFTKRQDFFTQTRNNNLKYSFSSFDNTLNLFTILYNLKNVSSFLRYDMSTYLFRQLTILDFEILSYKHTKGNCLTFVDQHLLFKSKRKLVSDSLINYLHFLSNVSFKKRWRGENQHFISPVLFKSASSQFNLTIFMQNILQLQPALTQHIENYPDPYCEELNYDSLSKLLLDNIISSHDNILSFITHLSLIPKLFYIRIGSERMSPVIVYLIGYVDKHYLTGIIAIE